MSMYNTAAYARQMALPEVGSAGQLRLQHTRALVIGAGGLGCPVLEYLSAVGVGTITVVDGDRVDEINLQRQTLYGIGDVGAFKAETAAQQLQKKYPWLSIKAHIASLNAENAQALIAAHAIVLECSDSLNTKFLVNATCQRLAKPLVVASLHQWEGQVALFPFNIRAQGCLRCVWPKQPVEGCVGDCAQTGIMGSMAGLLGVMQAHIAILHLLGNAQAFYDKQTLVDGMNLQTRQMHFLKNPTCPVCAEGNMERTEDAIVPLSIDALADMTDLYTLIDIREAEELWVSPLPDKITAMHLPLSRFEREHKQLPDGTLVLMCQSGKRSAVLALKLAKAGRPHVYSLNGGMNRLTRAQ